MSSTNKQRFEQVQSLYLSFDEYSRSIINSLKNSHPNKNNHPYYSEIHIWSQLRQFKDTHNTHILSYIHGFYSHLDQVCTLLLTNQHDPYFIKPSSIMSAVTCKEDLLLIYNINIRLGDLNRYLKNISMARHYYSIARELLPLRGHAYNQLSFISTGDPFKSIYYSVRSYLSVQEPVKMSKENIKASVNRYSLVNENISALLTDEKIDLNVAKINNWLYVIVIAIYCNNFRPVINVLFDETMKWLQKYSKSEIFQISSDPKWISPALDVLMDYMLQPSTKVNILEYEKNLLLLKNQLPMAKDPSNNALKHDFIMRGFSPIEECQNKLDYDVEEDEINPMKILLRIPYKCEKLISVINEKKIPKYKKSPRNIALQSILGSKS